MKAISNSSVTILIEFIGNALPFVIGFGTRVKIHRIINTIVPPRPEEIQHFLHQMELK